MRGLSSLAALSCRSSAQRCRSAAGPDRPSASLAANGRSSQNEPIYRAGGIRFRPSVAKLERNPRCGFPAHREADDHGQ